MFFLLSNHFYYFKKWVKKNLFSWCSSLFCRFILSRRWSYWLKRKKKLYRIPREDACICTGSKKMIKGGKFQIVLHAHGGSYRSLYRFENSFLWYYTSQCVIHARGQDNGNRHRSGCDKKQSTILRRMKKQQPHRRGSNVKKEGKKK